MAIDWSAVPRLREHRQLGERPRWFNGAPITSIAVDPRGRHVLTGSDRFLRLFWASSGELVRTLEGPGNDGTGYDRVGFSPDGGRVLAHIGPAREGNGALGIWSAETGALEKRIETPPVGRISVVDPWHTRVLARDRNAAALLLEEDGTHRVFVPRPDGGLGGGAFVSERRVVGMSSGDDVVRCWDTASGAVVWEKTVAARSSAAAAPRDAGGWVALGGSHDDVSVHDAETGEFRFALGEAGDRAGWVHALDATPDGRFLLSVSKREAVVWDVPKREAVVRVARSAEQTGAISPDGRWFVLGDDNAKLTRVMIANGAAEAVSEGSGLVHEAPIEEVRFDDRGGPVSRDAAKVALAWSPDAPAATPHRGPLPAPPPLPAWAAAVEASIAASVSSRASDTVEIVERFAAGDALAVTLSSWGSVEVWGRDGKHARDLPIGSAPGSLSFGRATALALHPSGRRLAIATSRPDTPIQLWDVETGEAIAVLEGSEGVVRALAFRDDGTELLAGGDDRLLRIWRIPPR